MLNFMFGTFLKVFIIRQSGMYFKQGEAELMLKLLNFFLINL